MRYKNVPYLLGCASVEDEVLVSRVDGYDDTLEVITQGMTTERNLQYPARNMYCGQERVWLHNDNLGNYVADFKYSTNPRFDEIPHGKVGLAKYDGELCWCCVNPHETTYHLKGKELLKVPTDIVPLKIVPHPVNGSIFITTSQILHFDGKGTNLIYSGDFPVHAVVFNTQSGHFAIPEDDRKRIAVFDNKMNVKFYEAPKRIFAMNSVYEGLPIVQENTDNGCRYTIIGTKQHIICKSTGPATFIGNKFFMSDDTQSNKEFKVLNLPKIRPEVVKKLTEVDI